MAKAPFDRSRYMIRKKIFKLFGEAFHIFDENGQVVMYSKLKAFKLREDIRVYTNEEMTTELLTIRARQILDFSAAYDVVDAQTGEKVGVLKRKGLKSIIKDEWIIMDAGDREIGLVQEDSLVLALLRRFLTNIIPQHFTAKLGETIVIRFHRHFNPFVLRMDMDFSADTGNLLDRRLGIAAGVLLSAIEGRQSSE